MTEAASPTMAPLRLATAEDDPRYRGSLALLLRNVPGFDHVASYGAAEPLLDAARRAHLRGEKPWDVVLTDMELPQADGATLTSELKKLFPDICAIVLTVFDDPARVLVAICAGADGYLLKSATPDELVEQLSAIVRHRSSLSASLAGTVLRLVRESHAGRLARSALPRDLGLTARQIEVLRALVQGKSYREIAEGLDISLDTVRSHIRQIYAALRVHNVAEAVSVALRSGLV